MIIIEYFAVKLTNRKLYGIISTENSTGGVIMLAVNYTTLRDNMKSYFDQIAEDKETMIVTRKDENMVIMSQSLYDSMMETLYLVSNENNMNHLMKSINQHKAGKAKRHELVGDTDE